MERMFSPRVGLALSLLLGAGTFAVTLAPSAAYAQGRDQKAERRVLKATDVDAATQQSEALRAAARAARLESISRLKEIISGTSAQGDQKAEMLLRLADLYFEEGRELYLTEMGIFQKAVDEEFNKPNGNTDNIKQADFVKESRGWQDKSIKLYKQILASYPQYQRADEATFYLGQALSDTGQTDPANTEFTKLVKTYPESRFVPDAYVLIGEYWFDKNEAYKALNAYQKAAAYKDHEKYAFANYKLAWCYYNVGDYPTAIDKMKAVVSYSMSESAVGPDGKPVRKTLQLQDEALKDLVRFFADAGEMDEAYEYFNKLGKKELIRDMLKRLASTYFEQGKFESSIQTYRRLIAEDPQGPAAPDFQNEIIQAYTKMGKKEDTLAEIDRLLKNYGKQSSWARTNASNQDAVKTAEELIEKGLRTVAINYHNEAKKLKTGSQAAQTYALAEKAYEVYIQEFPDSKYSYEVRYSYSELLYTIKKFDSAYDQYMKVVSIDTKGQHSRFCAESAIFAAEEMIKREAKNSGAGGPDPGKKTDAIPLSDWEQKQLKALDQFRELFPTDPKARQIIYKSAYLLYNKNQFKEASERFNVVISMDPKSKEAEQAANLILDSFALVEDWDSLKKNSKFYFDQVGLGSDSFKKEVYGVYENSSLKFIEINFKKTSDKKQGAADYWAFYQEFPSSQNADLALNNAAVYYRDLGNVTDSMKVRHVIVEKFPKSKYYKDQVAALGFDYESIANFGEAANWYEKLYVLDKAHPGAPDALYSAALFRNSLGQWEQAVKNYQQYITAFPDKPNLNGIQLDIARIYEEHEKWAEASKVYLGFYTPKPVVRGAPPQVMGSLDELMYARLHYGLLMDKLGQGAKVGTHWKETVAFFDIQKKAGAQFELSVEYVAQIMYILAEPQYQAYMAMKIGGPGDKKLNQKQTDKLLTEQLVSKVRAMSEVEKTYAGIIGTGAGEWGLAALARLGSAYENLSESLKGSWIPTYLTADQKELYTMALEDKAYPQIEKAAAAYSAALQKSYELNLYNDNTANATRRLGVLRPDDFPGLFEKIPEARYSAPSTFAGTIESEP
ncbi:MAG: tetratricopeptide repeat protein [Pseudomonadota bacterium]|nr:tetratricopeptide repeat protein [Pseudomonadota bacterium]